MTAREAVKETIWLKAWFKISMSVDVTANDF